MSQLHTRLAFSLAAGALVLGGCSTAREDVTWSSNGTPATQDSLTHEWNYQFVYYPAAQVYFEPHSDTYWWYDRNAWWEGSELPSWITIDTETPTVVTLPTDQPFERHWSMAGRFNYTLLPGSTDPRYACGLYARTPIGEDAAMMTTSHFWFSPHYHPHALHADSEATHAAGNINADRTVSSAEPRTYE